jgi:hypothetical protein
MRIDRETIRNDCELIAKHFRGECSARTAIAAIARVDERSTCAIEYDLIRTIKQRLQTDCEATLQRVPSLGNRNDC